MTREEVVALFKKNHPEVDEYLANTVGTALPEHVEEKRVVDYADKPMTFGMGDGAYVRAHKLNILAQLIYQIDSISTGEAKAAAMTAASYAVEPKGTFVKEWRYAGDGQFEYTETTNYSALHYALTLADEGDTQVERVKAEGDTQTTNVSNEGTSQVSRVIDEGDTQVARIVPYADAAYKDSREAEAEAMTADSFANEPENNFVKEYYYDEATDSILFNELADTYSSLHWSNKAAQVAAGLTFQGTWDSVDCSMPPTPTPPSGESANGYLWIVSSVTGDNSSCPDLSIGDWIVWDGDDPGTPEVEGQWSVINWTFDWSAITNIPDNVVNAVTQAEVDAGDQAVQDNLNAHIGNKSNPHEVTAAQIDAVNKSGDTMTGTLGFDTMKPFIFYSPLSGASDIVELQKVDNGDGTWDLNWRIGGSGSAFSKMMLSNYGDVRHSWDENGNYVAHGTVSSGEAPTELEHLTRKDYVDGVILKLLNKLNEAGITIDEEDIFNS